MQLNNNKISHTLTNPNQTNLYETQNTINNKQLMKQFNLIQIQTSLSLYQFLSKDLEVRTKARLDETHPTSQLKLLMCLKLFINTGLLNSELVTVQASYSTRVTMP